jgi:hypothetical protein
MTRTRFTCTLTTANEHAYQAGARVTHRRLRGRHRPRLPPPRRRRTQRNHRRHVDWVDSKASTNGSARPSNSPRNEATSHLFCDYEQGLPESF